MRATGDTIREKIFPGGFLAIIGSRSPADLASKPIRVVLADEIDRYEVTKEGDPLKLARQRTANFNNRKLIYVSIPTVKQRDDGGPSIYDEYELSDKREYEVKCPHCENYFVMKWEHVKWEKDDRDKVIEDSIRLECPNCHAKLRGAGKPSPHLLESGRWVATAKSKIVGFHMTALVSPWVNLSQMVNEFVRAAHNRDKQGLREFYNLRLGEPFEEYKGALVKWEKLLQRCEYYPEGGFSDDVIFLTAGVDVQRDRLECSIYGWGVGWESWLIDHHVLSGDPQEAHVWGLLDDLLFKTEFKNASGKKRKLVCTCIDSGDGVMTDKVYAYTKAREYLRVVSIKGRGGMAVPFTSRPTRAGVKKALLYILGVDAGKDIITGCLDVPTRGPNYVHFPRGKQYVDAEFLKQLTAEVQKPVKNKITGVIKYEWVKLRERNKALDCAVYARAAATIVQPDFEALKEQLRGM